MKKITFIFFLLLGITACKKESLTEVLKGDKSTVINQLSKSWVLDYKDSYYTLNAELGDVMTLYNDSKCTLYSPKDPTVNTSGIWELSSSLYSVKLDCIQGTALNDSEWNVDDLTNDQLWISKVVGDKNLVLRFSKK